MPLAKVAQGSGMKDAARHENFTYLFDCTFYFFAVLLNNVLFCYLLFVKFLAIKTIIIINTLLE